MYQIYSNGELIYDPRIPELSLEDPILELPVNSAGSLTFSIENGHPRLDTLQKLSSTIEVNEGNTILFRGRLISDEKGFYNERDMKIEGLLAALNDSIIRPFQFPTDVLDDEDYVGAAEDGNVVEFFLGWILSKHNAQVNTNRQIQLGTVTVSDPNNYIERSSEGYHNSWDTIKDKLFGGSLGGYVYPSYDNQGNTYLNYVSEFTDYNLQDVVFGENLADLSNTSDASDTYSAVLPLGADIENEETGESAPLTIADLPDGDVTSDVVKEGDYLYSRAAVANYGWIFAPTDDTTWDDVTLATNLQSKGVQYLASIATKQTETIEISAADLGLVENDVYAFRPYKKVLAKSKPHDLKEAFDLVQFRIRMANPAETMLTLGRTQLTLTDSNAATQRSTDEKIEKTYSDIHGNTKAINELSQRVTEQSTSIIQDAQQIILTALENYVTTGDFTSYQETVAASLAVMSDQIVMNFTTTTNQITATNDEIARIYNERLRYIRFVDGNIILGEEGNELVLTIRNDRISFTQDNLEVAYFSNQKLYVTNGEFINSLQLGVFGFVPAQDGQSLSFKKVS